MKKLPTSINDSAWKKAQRAQRRIDSDPLLLELMLHRGRLEVRQGEIATLAKGIDEMIAATTNYIEVRKAELAATP